MEQSSASTQQRQDLQSHRTTEMKAVEERFVRRFNRGIRIVYAIALAWMLFLGSWTAVQHQGMYPGQVVTTQAAPHMPASTLPI